MRLFVCSFLLVFLLYFHKDLEVKLESWAQDEVEAEAKAGTAANDVFMPNDKLWEQIKI